MSTISIVPSVSAPPLPPMTPPAEPIKVHLPILIEEEVLIPGWVVDQDSFRRWARSDDFPTSGRYSFIDGMLWVDRTMEEIFGHNQIKTRYSRVLDQLICDERRGYFLSDGCLWSHVGAGISTIPDSLFFTYDTLTSDRIRFIKGATHGYMEVEGTPDMTLEIVSDSSVKKDNIVMKEKCAKAGVREYWLVDARGATALFEIWLLREGNYESVAAEDGWLRSVVFGKAFKLQQEKDPLGHPSYQLLLR